MRAYFTKVVIHSFSKIKSKLLSTPIPVQMYIVKSIFEWSLHVVL